MTQHDPEMRRAKAWNVVSWEMLYGHQSPTKQELFVYHLQQANETFQRGSSSAAEALPVVA